MTRNTILLYERYDPKTNESAYITTMPIRVQAGHKVSNQGPIYPIPLATQRSTLRYSYCLPPRRLLSI